MSPVVTVGSCRTRLEEDQTEQCILVLAGQKHRVVPSPPKAYVSVDSFCHKDGLWQLAQRAYKLGLESFSYSVAFLGVSLAFW